MAYLAAVMAVAAAAGMVALRLRRSRRLADDLTGTRPWLRTADGVRLHVEVDDPARAPVTVVLVHGFAARSSMFDPQWSALRGRARLIRYDQRGHGASGWAGAASVGLRRLGQDLGEIVDDLAGAGPVVLVGHSMGGMAVLALARERPELFGQRVVGVALISTAAGPLADGRLAPRLLRGLAALDLDAALARLLWLAAPVLQALHPFRTRRGRRSLARHLFAGDPPEPAVRRMTRSWRSTPLAVASAFLPGLVAYDARDALAALRTVPVLVLAGQHDATLAAGYSERLAGRIGPTARLVVVPDAGHMVPLTHASAVNAALLDLLAASGAAPDERRTP